MLQDVSAIQMLILQLAISEMRRRYALSQTDGSRFDAGFVPKTFVDEALQQLGTAFYEETLYAALIQVGKYLPEALVGIDNGGCAAIHQM